MTLNETHDPSRESWIASANDPASGFPLQNLPFGVFGTEASPEPRIGVAIGDRILDLAAAAAAGLLPSESADPCREPSLNALMAAGAAAWSPLRSRLSELLGSDSCSGEALRRKVERCLVPMAGARMRVPARIGNYTDFYASLAHASNVGAMFRPDNPLLPNYKWVPIGYHGRASSIVAGGTPVRRPRGQTRGPDATEPAYGPCRHLDYELEVAAFVGPGNALGETIPISEAGNRLFGVCLLNDWSARDIQAWEYQPLGPFLAKSFASSVSPWVVTLDALAPFRVPAFARPAGDPAPLPYLSDDADRREGGLDITLEVALLTPAMRAAGAAPFGLSRTSFRNVYWTLAQMLAHHASNGCNLQPGDLLGSGTVSGASRDEFGCLLELTKRGKEPVLLPGGETRGFLEDGDEVVMTGHCERDGFRRIGLGECRGVVLPA
jgi:fumarylacetoacetase